MTYRSNNRIVEKEGINFIKNIVEAHNCIFHEIDGSNDQGNDVYIEFVVNNVALNFGVFVQIKSGNSYKDSKGYKIPTDKAHLKYWSNGLYPTIGIVYDIELKSAFWINISDYLANNPGSLESDTHTIHLSSALEFSADTFNSFINYFIGFSDRYKSFENFGRGLDLFSQIEIPEACYEGFQVLYSNHRDKSSTWYYLILNFSKIKEEGIRHNILGVLSNVAENPDLFWHKGNMKFLPSEQIKGQVSSLLTNHFGKNETQLVLPYLKDGITRGSFSFLVYLVVAMSRNSHYVLKELAFERSYDPYLRNFCFWLYLHLAQNREPKEILMSVISDYQLAFNEASDDEAIHGMIESIKEGSFVYIG